MHKLTLEDLTTEQLRGKRVLVRVDYNVPLDENQQVTDDTRIRATLPTLQRLIDAGARVVLLSHLGRPKGKRVPELSLLPVARRLAEMLGTKVDFVGETVGEQARSAVNELGNGEVLLLENTRYLAGEESNDLVLARQLADLSDLYINDAFGAAHRAHASTAGVAEMLQERGGVAAAGLLMQRELQYLGSAVREPSRPFLAILGGAKISGKIDVVEALLPQVDHLLVGGAMANTFFRALGLNTGTSLVEEDRVALARTLLDRAGETLVLPVDVVVARALHATESARVVARDAIPEGMAVYDVGPETVERFADIIAAAGTVLWNGPMGVFETQAFAGGTHGVAGAVAEATDHGAITIVGGGDSAAAVAEMKLDARISHVSTGGGASLEFLEGKPLPGVAALTDAPRTGA